MSNYDIKLDQRIDNFLTRKFNEFPEIDNNDVSRIALRRIERIKV